MKALPPSPPKSLLTADFTQADGFTLIEMSIVLVIIGFIIGGILVGRDMISASEVRAQIAQIEKYNSAVNTFKNKYGGLPGDLNGPLATQFGFYTGQGCDGTTGGASAAARNGDGILDGWFPSSPQVTQREENLLFWIDLSAANLIEGIFPGSGALFPNCAVGVQQALTATTAGYYFPPARMGHGLFLYVYGSNSQNYYGLSAITTVDTNGVLSSNASIPVIQAYNIDKKVDDGLPTSGSVTATYIGSYAVGNAPSGASDTSTTCYSGTTPTFAYSLSAAANGGTGLNCALSFRFQ